MPHPGPGDLVELARIEIAAREARRPFVIASGTLNRDTDVVEKLADAIGAVGLFEQTVAHVPRPSVFQAAEAVRAAGADLLVTVGGGTPIDTAKMVLFVLGAGIVDDAGLDEYAVRTDPDGTRHVKSAGSPPLRQIVIPTTLSGAEFSDLAGCVDPGTSVKQLFTGAEIGSAAVLIDPAVTTRTPEWLWLSTGIRAVDHAVESLCSVAPNPYADATAQHALRLLASSLRRTKEAPADLASRQQSQLAVWLACTGLNRVPWGASHGIGHQLGAVAGVPHGYCSCVMLPHVLRYNHPATVDAQQTIAEALGGSGTAADAVATLVAELGLPTRLRDLGVREAQLDTIAELSVANMFVRQNPRPLMTAAPIRQILEAAY
jgi:alcohol dehydrogenase class IV